MAQRIICPRYPAFSIPCVCAHEHWCIFPYPVVYVRWSSIHLLLFYSLCAHVYETTHWTNCLETVCVSVCTQMSTTQQILLRLCVCAHTRMSTTQQIRLRLRVCVCAHTCLRHHKFSWDYVCVCVHTHVYDTTTCLETCVCVCAHTCLRHNNMSWDMCVCVCLCAYACGLQSFRVQSDFCGLQIPDSVSSVCWRCHLGVINGITSWAPHPWSVDCSRVSFACATGYPELIPGSYKSKDIPALPMYDL